MVFTAGFSSAIYPLLVFFTSYLPFSAANVSHTAGGSAVSPRSRAGQSIARTLPRARALTRHPAAPKAQTSIFNCYMGESDVSFSFYLIVMCIIITLGQEFSALLMVCMEKINHLAINCQRSNCSFAPSKFFGAFPYNYDSPTVTVSSLCCRFRRHF